MSKEFESFYLAKTWKRITARIIDIIFVSLFLLLITLILWLINQTIINNLIALIIMILINFVVLFIYFIIIPWKLNGQTIGKKILSIRLVDQNNKKIILKSVLLRELFLVFIPATLASCAILVASIFLKSNLSIINNEHKDSFLITVLIRVIFSFIFAWYLGIIITTKIDRKHQLFYDRKFNIYTIDKHQVKNGNHPDLKKDNNIIHFHLGEKQPGNIAQKDLEEISNL